MAKRIDKESMPCNKPRKSPKAGKKRVVKACEGGKEKIIHYGASEYPHNYSDAARKNFRARHGCDENPSKLSARYWACKDLWTKGGSSKSTGSKGGTYRGKK
jgi:hypothetical protein